MVQKTSLFLKYSSIVALIILLVLGIAPLGWYADAASPSYASANVAAPAKVRVLRVTSETGKQISIKVKAAKNANGYQFMTSQSKKFFGPTTKQAKSAKRTCTFKKLVPNKKYYVKARAYNKKGRTIKWGKWSAAKSIIVRKPTMISDMPASLTSPSTPSVPSAPSAPTTPSTPIEQNPSDSLAKLETPTASDEPTSAGESSTLTDPEVPSEISEPVAQETLEQPSSSNTEQQTFYIYTESGKIAANSTVWDDESQSYIPITVYDLYIEETSSVPPVGSVYHGSTVIATSTRPDETYPAGSITLLSRLDLKSLMMPSFEHCVEINLSKADTSNMTSLSMLFHDCKSLVSVNLSGWNTSNITSMGGVFYGCQSLTTVDLSSWDTSNVTTIANMFYGCKSLQSANISNWNLSKVTDRQRPFYNYAALKTITAYNLVLGSVGLTFNNLNSLENIEGMGTWNTARTTDMSIMFFGCWSLKNIDVSSFNTKNVTNMASMFYGCSEVTNLDTSRFETAKVTDMSKMFYGCSQLSSIDVSGFDTSSVTNMREMFSYCYNLQSVDLHNFDTSNVTDLWDMFNCCRSLSRFDLSSFDTSKVDSFFGMFNNCNSMTYLETGPSWIVRKGVIQAFFPVDMVNEDGKVCPKLYSAALSGAHVYTAAQS